VSFSPDPQFRFIFPFKAIDSLQSPNRPSSAIILLVLARNVAAVLDEEEVEIDCRRDKGIPTWTSADERGSCEVDDDGAKE